MPPPLPPPPPAPYGMGAPPPAPVYAPASSAELMLRRLDPELRRFVASYARRRHQLTLEVRIQLAAAIQPSLQSAVPDVLAQAGPLAALDHLANLELAG